MRVSWAEYALRLAIVGTTRSVDIYKQVGACALDYNNRVIGVAYNGLAPGKEVDPSFWNDREARMPYMLHAETNLLSLFKRGQARLLACTLLPCSACARQIVAHGIQEVVYGEIYKKDTGAFDIFKFYNISVQQIDL
jgi:dCMP deaminase